MNISSIDLNSYQAIKFFPAGSDEMMNITLKPFAGTNVVEQVEKAEAREFWGLVSGSGHFKRGKTRGGNWKWFNLDQPITPDGQCHATTKKGDRCRNKAKRGQLACGIPAHKAQLNI